MDQVSTFPNPLQFGPSVGDSETGARSALSLAARPVTSGKFLRIGADKLWVKGVTYGTFRPAPGESDGYPPAHTIEADFAAMAAAGVNTLRTYTVPPTSLLDTAHEYGLRVMIGLPWEQHVAFLDTPGMPDSIVARVRDAVRRCAGHPAVFCYAVGNEIPAPIVRWHGRRRIERFIRRLYDTVKSEDPRALVTYVNYPTTEYLQLPFLDIVCFNVYLESEERLGAYLARLQNIAGERPLVLAEIGLDSRRNGEAAQAESLAWQLRATFAAGCAGAFVFGWTDEWHRGGYDIEDWDFGLTTRDRHPKAALAAVEAAYSQIPFAHGLPWPRVSVVVCSYNGARTIRDTLEGLARVDYPDFEVIVVNDGSNDATPQIAGEYGVRLITTENRGLSAARNTGWQQATGEIVAYIDDDAYPDEHWLKYLAYAFLTTLHVGVGGPNIAPPGDGPIADCVANAPGGPVHVLLTDTLAEHIPGCNLAFLRSALAAIDGFDVRYRAAGDDVDLCWRLMERGGTIGFHAGAMDWHHRRNSLKMYWRQQQGYGKAEALLEEKWPERYNAAGHLSWGGRVYGRGFTLPIPSGRSRIYGGVWGTAAYQSLYEPGPTTLLALPLMPEWYLVIGVLAVLSVLGLSWSPLLWAVPFLVLSVAAPVAQAATAATRARFPVPARSAGIRLQRWALTFAMHLMQPAARLYGRLKHGLTPWRRRGEVSDVNPRSEREFVWSESWSPLEAWVERFENALRTQGAIVRRGGDYDEWDLDVRGGVCGGVRVLVGLEEHGGGKQLVRTRALYKPGIYASAVTALLVALGALALFDGAWLAALGLTALAALLGSGIVRDCNWARRMWDHCKVGVQTSNSAGR
ncbi:MAG TPA: glycosyltransferase [Burkholderiales bacterium]|nr:glycosyltransferase [Burkholderiales bacterium]